MKSRKNSDIQELEFIPGIGDNNHLIKDLFHLIYNPLDHRTRIGFNKGFFFPKTPAFPSGQDHTTFFSTLRAISSMSE